MIDKIIVQHKEEMAQIFLIVIEEPQPLPLFAFALLKQERKQPHLEQYAIKAQINPFESDALVEQYPDLKLRIDKRCSDLLIVDDLPHAVYLSHSGDFFHRTICDFLWDSYRDRLDHLVKPEFNPPVSLCNICLAL